jgi:general secretion pathway protein J
MKSGKSQSRMADSRVAASSAAWGWLPAPTIPKAFGLEAATRRKPRSAIGGFTLAEVLVASTISGFIAVVAVGALNALARSSQMVNRATETTSEIRFAARMLAHDLENLYRDLNPQNMKLVGSSEGAVQGGPPFLTFYTTGRAKARANLPEGDVYEVEYFLGTRPQQEGEESADSLEESTVLFRRLWPNPDKDRTPGGVLTPIAANIGLFQVRFYDGQEWSAEWTEEMRSLPEYLEVTLTTLPPEKGDPLVETLTVTFPRLSRAAEAAALQGGAAQGDQGRQGAGTSSTGPSASPTSSSSGSDGPPSSGGSSPKR